MTLQLEIVSDHRELVGDDAVRVFRETGGTIGRSLQNDWILPDPDRYISGRHATIDYRGGVYYLLDTSSNGVYVNGDCEPLGKGKLQRLFDGDRLRLGDFEIVVSIDEGESLVTALDDTDVNHPVHETSLVGSDSLRTGVQLLDEEELTGDDEFQATLFGTPLDAGVAELARAKVESSKAAAPGSQSVQTLADAAPETQALLDAFLRGLGMSHEELHPATSLLDVMENAGEVLREFVAGTSKLIAGRADMKNSFRLDQTTVLPRQNNPLKLSANTGDSIKQLLVGKEGEYLSPGDAVREACRDLLFHQDAFLGAMRSAFEQFADRFDPDELERDFEQHHVSPWPLKYFRRPDYWQLYRDLYPVITEAGDGALPQTYAEEFIRAYEHGVVEARRQADAADFKATVVLDQNRVQIQPVQAPSNDDDFSEVFEDAAQQANG
jgi:type VI secretion system FHA domain protein